MHGTIMHDNEVGFNGIIFDKLLIIYHVFLLGKKSVHVFNLQLLVSKFHLESCFWCYFFHACSILIKSKSVN